MKKKELNIDKLDKITGGSTQGTCGYFVKVLTYLAHNKCVNCRYYVEDEKHKHKYICNHPTLCSKEGKNR